MTLCVETVESEPVKEGEISRAVIGRGKKKGKTMSSVRAETLAVLMCVDGIPGKSHNYF